MIATPDRAPRRSLVSTLTSRPAPTMIRDLALQAGLVAVRDYCNETDFLNSDNGR